MKRLCLILVASTVPMLSSAAPVPNRGISSHPVVEVIGNLEVDQVYYIKGSVTLPPPIGKVEVDLQVTTCKQGTSGCKPS